jgi:sterol desaturase/sphingolipid hydroxylase (fatty acid hydroxylase superfamily)
LWPRRLWHVYGLLFALIATAIALVCCAAAAEMVRPWRPSGGSTGRRRFANLVLLGLSYGLGLALAPIVAAMAAMANLHLRPIESINGTPFGIAGAIICLDFLDYALHCASHRIAPLWRIHQAHHSDIELDITTLFRHHPFEAALTSFVIGGGGLLLGFSIPEITIYGALSVFVQIAAHANLVLPRWMTSLLSPVLVTPDFHRIHHSRLKSQADANYGQVFSFWDRIFGSHRVGDAGAVEFGLDTRREPQYQRLSWLLTQPMRCADDQAYPARAPR